MASCPQILAIALTFLCDYFINHNDKKWISNVILLILISISIIFVCLLDEKLDRDEAGKKEIEKENKNNIKETEVIQVNNNDNKG